FGGAEHAAVREVDRGAQPVRVVREIRIDPIRPRPLALARRALDEPDHRLDREPRCDLARVVPAHPVGDDEEAERFVAGEGVFVAFADATDVGQAECFNHECEKYIAAIVALKVWTGSRTRAASLCRSGFFWPQATS